MGHRIRYALLFILSFHSITWAQERATRNVIIVTLDGLRWQEVFRGVDPRILRDGKYLRREDTKDFWHPAESERRRMLMPFLWSQVVAKGQLYGNRRYGNRVNCSNHHLLSYPGYSEMLVGFTHHKISSNRKVENPHPTVLEWIEEHESFDDAVAAFATWETFSYILRESRSGLYINVGSDLASGDITPREMALNRHYVRTGVRSDSLTWAYAMEYLERERPRVTLISFDETDQAAHDGDYAGYLRAAHDADTMIAELWRWVQSQPDYRNRTTLLITTDHGRGKGRNNWRVHRLFARGSRHIWFAVLGPDTPALGEVKTRSKIYQRQMAKTIAAFLGLPYRNEAPVGETISTVITKASSPNAADD